MNCCKQFRMIMNLFILSVFLPLVCSACTHNQCPGCPCFKVNTVATSTDELIRNSPLYSQAASNISRSYDLDSVCMSYHKTFAPDNLLVQTVFAYKDRSKEELKRARILVQNGAGSFLVAGPNSSFIDHIIGKPCEGAFVIYRCIQVGAPCAKTKPEVDVFVTSVRRHETSKCIEAGAEIALKTFPNNGFYTLARISRPTC